MENKITIEFAHICENVIVANNGNLSVINIFNQVASKTFPAIHPILFIVVGALGQEGEYEVKIEIKKTPGGESLVPSQALPNKMKIPQSPGQGRLFVKFSPLAIKEPGDYEIVIIIDGQIKVLSFQAVKIN